MKQHRRGQGAKQMAGRPRKSQETERERARSATAISRHEAVVLAIFLGALVCYLVLFYTAVPVRTQSFSLLLLPDVLFASWVGGDISRFGLLDRTGLLFVAALIMSSAYVVGRLVMEWVGANRGLTRLEAFIFALGVGLNLLSLYTLAVGLLGGLRYLLVFTLPMIVILALAGLKWKSRWFAQQSSFNGELLNGELLKGQLDNPNVRNASDWLSCRWLWLAAPFVLLVVMSSMLPPVDFDVREYHLQVPKEWYQQGRIDFLPHNVYGNMPLGAEMHALLGMVLMQGDLDWWWGALAGKTVIAMFMPLTALALFAAGKRFVSSTAGVVAALLYVSTAWVARVSASGLNEGALAFYFFLAVYALLLWSDGISARSQREKCPSNSRALLLLAGFMGGSAAACKYTAIPFVVIPLAFWVLMNRFRHFTPDRSALSFSKEREQESKAEDRRPFLGQMNFKMATVFLLAVTAGCGLWFGKNWILAHNPTYPLLGEVFAGKTRTPEKNLQWKRAHSVPPYSIAELGDKLSLVAWRSEWHSPLLAPLAMLGLFCAGYRRLAITLAVLFFYVFAIWWLFTHRLDRFWVPALPLVALLGGIGVTWSAVRLWRRVFIVLLLAGLLSNFLVMALAGVQDRRVMVALEDLRSDTPSSKDGGSRVNPVHRYLNKTVRDGEQVLLVGDAQPFDLEVSTVYNTCFDDCIFELWMKDHSKEERLATLRKHRISHIYIYWSEIHRYRKPGNYGFTDYVTRELVYDELVQRQGILRKVDLENSSFGELFEVVDYAGTPPQ